jgi:hypothetical protein
VLQLQELLYLARFRVTFRHPACRGGSRAQFTVGSASSVPFSPVSRQAGSLSHTFLRKLGHGRDDQRSAKKQQRCSPSASLSLVSVRVVSPISRMRGEGRTVQFRVEACLKTFAPYWRNPPSVTRLPCDTVLKPLPGCLLSSTPQTSPTEWQVRPVVRLGGGSRPLSQALEF